MEIHKAKYAAIDPGASGGIAWVDLDDRYHAVKIPEGPRDWFEFLQHLDPRTVVVEKVGFHRIGNSASSSVKFARTCGLMEGFLVALGLPQVQVTPSKWMRGFLASKVPKERSVRKNAIKAKVQMLHPELKVTLATADAMAILIWYMETERNRQ